MRTLIDDRFTGTKHFWSAIAVDRPRKLKNLEDNIKLYAPEGNFSTEEQIHFLTELTGQFPLSKVVDDKTLRKLEEMHVPPLSEYDRRLGLAWCIPRQIILKKTATGKDYLLVEVTDSNSSNIRVRCWGVNPTMGDLLQLNKPYLMKPAYNEQWGFSTRGRISKYWKILA